MAAVFASLDAGVPWTEPMHTTMLSLLPADPLRSDLDLERGEPLAVVEALLGRGRRMERKVAFALVDAALQDGRAEVRAEGLWAADRACMLSRSAPRRLVWNLRAAAVDEESVVALSSLLGRLGSVAAPAADILAPLAGRNPDHYDDHADRALAALVLVAPAQAAPLLAAGLGRRPRALDAAAGFGSPEDFAFPYSGELLDAVRDRLARPEALSGNEPWQLTNLLTGWGAEAAPALPELCAALQRFPGQAARAIASVAALCAQADRARAVTSLRAVAAEQGALPAAKALHDLDGEIAPLLHCLEQDLRRGAGQLREAARMAGALGPRAAELAPDHLLLSVKGQRLDGKWGSIHTLALHENTVAASALYNELVAAEVCEALGLATEPRTVTPGRRPVMEIAGVPHELIRWTSRRSDQIAACMAELEYEYVTAVNDDGTLKFLPVVSERGRAKLNQIAARKTRPPKQQTRPLAQLRVWWKVSAILTSGVAVDIITSLLEYARAAAAATRARVASVVDVALAAVDVAATVFVMNDGGRFHRRHLLAEARRHLALVLRGRPRERGLDEKIVAAAISTHCLDISEPKTTIGLLSDYRLYTARWTLSDLPDRRRPPTPAPDPDRQPPADPGEPAAPRPPGQDAGEWEIPRIPLQYERAALAGAVVREKLRTTTPAVRGRAYDVVAHQQAAMPEQLLAPAAADPEDQDQEPEAGPWEAIDMTALRDLRESRTDVEALDLTAERLRHLQDAFTKAAGDSRTRATRYTEQDDPDAVGPVRRDDQQAHRPQEPGPHRGREAGHWVDPMPRTRCGGAHRRCRALSAWMLGIVPKCTTSR
ncbi:hypothetical protein BGK67_31935 [Streptomyces subrutilus]|uniref:TrwC relaxase domain-containing protein n=2 Tax=Streptomyces subrutilus TaxID=36818 RepID=A0A1E5Q097_9ACTN|nr:hypothetical protein BGK67_31935 [Streptomyces subrutilus]